MYKKQVPHVPLTHQVTSHVLISPPSDMLFANGAAALLLLPLRCPAPRMRSELIIEQGDGWLVVNKPRGMVVHDGPDSLITTLAEAGHPSATPCHRLDAETSGLMLLSENPEKTGQLIKCLAHPETTKQYRGVVKGVLEGAGVWSQSISPKPEGRRNPRGFSKDRVEAVTGYAALANTPYLTAVDFVLGSGRTHQIRKHASAKGHFIVGDTRYGEPKHAAQMSTRLGFEGMALHAACLRISIDGVAHDFTAPLPPEFSSLLDEFGELPAASPATSPAAAELRRRSRSGRPSRIEGAPHGARGARYTGEVASWNVRKGYGFIRHEGKGLDNIYVHHRSIEGEAEGFRSLRKGETVTFDVSEMEDGKLEATRVTGPGGKPVLGGDKVTEEPEQQPGRSGAGPNGALPPGAYRPKK